MNKKRRLLFSFLMLMLAAACGPLQPFGETIQSQENDPEQAVRVSTAATSPEPIIRPSTESPSPAETMLSTASIEYGSPVPFYGLQMFGPAEGWAWGRGLEDGNQHLWQTLDGGLTWTDISPKDVEICHLFSRNEFINPLHAWIKVCGLPDQGVGLAHTADGGETWTVVNTSLPHESGVTIRFFNKQEGILGTYGAAAGKGIWQLQETYDGGTIWEWIDIASMPDGIPPDRPGQFTVCNICGDILYIDPDRMIVIRGNLSSDPSEDIILHFSADHGRHWRKIVLPLPSGDFSFSWIHPFSPVFPDYQNGILPVILSEAEEPTHTAAAFFATSDGGLSWTFRSLLENMAEKDVFQGLEVISNEDYFLPSEYVLYITHDGAFTWEILDFPPVFYNPEYLNPDMEGGIRTIEFGDLNSGLMLLNSGEDLRTLWHTVDGGISWSLLSPVLLPRMYLLNYLLFPGRAEGHILLHELSCSQKQCCMIQIPFWVKSNANE